MFDIIAVNIRSVKHFSNICFVGYPTFLSCAQKKAAPLGERLSLVDDLLLRLLCLLCLLCLRGFLPLLL